MCDCKFPSKRDVTANCRWFYLLPRTPYHVSFEPTRYISSIEKCTISSAPFYMLFGVKFVFVCVYVSRDFSVMHCGVSEFDLFTHHIPERVSLQQIVSDYMYHRECHKLFSLNIHFFNCRIYYFVYSCYLVLWRHISFCVRMCITLFLRNYSMSIDSCVQIKGLYLPNLLEDTATS